MITFLTTLGIVLLVSGLAFIVFCLLVCCMFVFYVLYVFYIYASKHEQLERDKNERNT